MEEVKSQCAWYWHKIKINAKNKEKGKNQQVYNAEDMPA